MATAAGRRDGEKSGRARVLVRDCNEIAQSGLPIGGGATLPSISGSCCGEPRCDPTIDPSTGSSPPDGAADGGSAGPASKTSAITLTPKRPLAIAFAIGSHTVLLLFCRPNTAFSPPVAQSALACNSAIKWCHVGAGCTTRQRFESARRREATARFTKVKFPRVGAIDVVCRATIPRL